MVTPIHVRDEQVYFDASGMIGNIPLSRFLDGKVSFKLP